MNVIVNRFCFVFALCRCAFALGAQEERMPYYEINAPTEIAARTCAAEMNERFAAYNAVFRFDPASLASPMRVRVFTGKDEYDAYVGVKLGSVKAGAVYLHYSDPQKSELVIHKGSTEAENAFPHQAFIQFIRAFIPEPPAWIRDGFATYFSALSFDEAAGNLVYKENLAWLEAAKRAPVNLDAAFLADGAAPYMEPVLWTASAWALVSFFMSDTAGGYYRALTDSFMVLNPLAGSPENARAVYKRLILFNPAAAITADYSVYLAGKKTLAELVAEGQKQYAAKNYPDAALSFREAASRVNNEYVPWYYLGLIAYAEKNFSEAERLYQTALRYSFGREAVSAIIAYARGVNAAALGQKAEAAAFLREAATLDGARFQAKCDELLGKLE